MDVIGTFKRGYEDAYSNSPWPNFPTYDYELGRYTYAYYAGTGRNMTLEEFLASGLKWYDNKSPDFR